MKKVTAQEAAKHYLKALKNDSPIVSTSHLVMHDMRKLVGEKEFDAALKEFDAALKEQQTK